MNREDLVGIVKAAIAVNGGEASIVQVAKYIWDNHEAELRLSGDLFYTWQYDMRWASQRLRDARLVTLSKRAGQNTWRLL